MAEQRIERLVYGKDGFSLWIQEEYHRLKSGITIEIITQYNKDNKF